MNKNNKIADSKHRQQIESLLLAGVSYRKVSEEMKALGFEVSHNSIKEYHNKHMAGAIEKQDIEQEEPIYKEGDVIDVSTLPEGNYAIFQEAYRNQLQMFLYKQRQCMNGKARYPEAELRALRILDELMRANHLNRENAGGEPGFD